MNIPNENCLIDTTTNEVVVLSVCKKYVVFADGKVEPFINSEKYKDLPKNLEITKKE